MPLEFYIPPAKVNSHQIVSRILQTRRNLRSRLSACGSRLLWHRLRSLGGVVYSHSRGKWRNRVEKRESFLIHLNISDIPSITKTPIIAWNLKVAGKWNGKLARMKIVYQSHAIMCNHVFMAPSKCRNVSEGGIRMETFIPFRSMPLFWSSQGVKCLKFLISIIFRSSFLMP